MRTLSFRLKSPTIGIRALENTAVILSAGEIIKLSEPLPEGDGEMITVQWSGVGVKMFARDIRERGEEVSGTSA